MGEKKDKKIEVRDARLERVFESAECRTQVELADFLGVRQSSISDAKRRGSIPAEWLLTLLQKKWVNPTWVLNGEGAIYLRPATDGPVERVQILTERRPAAECSIEELFREMVRRAENQDSSR